MLIFSPCYVCPGYAVPSARSTAEAPRMNAPQNFRRIAIILTLATVGFAGRAVAQGLIP